MYCLAHTLLRTALISMLNIISKVQIILRPSFVNYRVSSAPFAFSSLQLKVFSSCLLSVLTSNILKTAIKGNFKMELNKIEHYSFLVGLGWGDGIIGNFNAYTKKGTCIFRWNF